MRQRPAKALAKPGNLGHQLRASATLAFFIPARRAIRIAQLFRAPCIP
ncbi:hypothetical protein X768_22915 [Mesorhizobium sp. LSJC265A00]|nr:hypothetical protein X768_22915 [Mesorhizobium sp. LSJC265A00]